MGASVLTKRSFWIAAGAIVVVAGILSTAAGRDLAGRWLGSLRVQKVQAVNLDLSPFVDANANPALHQMVSQMISDKVDVTLNEPNQPASDRAAASALAGFAVAASGSEKGRAQADRGRAARVENDGGPFAARRRFSRRRAIRRSKCRRRIDGASFSVQIGHAVHAQYGTCPGRLTATNAIAGQVIETAPSVGQYSDCVRLAEGPSPVVNVPREPGRSEAGGGRASGSRDVGRAVRASSFMPWIGNRC